MRSRRINTLKSTIEWIQENIKSTMETLGDYNLGWDSRIQENKKLSELEGRLKSSIHTMDKIKNEYLSLFNLAKIEFNGNKNT